MFVRPSVCPIPSQPVTKKKSMKQEILLNKVVKYTSRVTNILSDSCCSARQGKPSYVETDPKKSRQDQKLTSNKNPQYLSYHHETCPKEPSHG